MLLDVGAVRKKYKAEQDPHLRYRWASLIVFSSGLSFTIPVPSPFNVTYIRLL